VAIAGAGHAYTRLVRAVLMFIVAAVSAPLALVAYTNQPVPGRTGGFGGPTCHACHTGVDLNAPGGELTLGGLPERYTPGETYRLVVELKRAKLARGGFSLAARFASGARSRTQAGEWQSSDPGVVFHADVRTKVSYAQHTPMGAAPTEPGAIKWELVWKAPAEAETVQFNLAATASNNDGSPLGDVVYAREVTLAPALR
jgi:hypothetical protein